MHAVANEKKLWKELELNSRHRALKATALTTGQTAPLEFSLDTTKYKASQKFHFNK